MLWIHSMELKAIQKWTRREVLMLRSESIQWNWKIKRYHWAGPIRARSMNPFNGIERNPTSLIIAPPVMFTESIQWNWKLEVLCILTNMKLHFKNPFNGIERLRWSNCYKRYPCNKNPFNGIERHPVRRDEWEAVYIQESIQWNWKVRYYIEPIGIKSESENPFNGIERWSWMSTGCFIAVSSNPFNGIESDFVYLINYHV